MRLSSDQLGAIGEVRVDGFPLLEDLRPHLSPAQRAQYDERALHAMRYDEALYGVPASQDALSLIYNKAIFDARGVDYPDSTWTQQDLLEAAQTLTYQDVQGLALPVKSAYWWFGFQAGWGGSLFNETGVPSLNSNGSAEALDWLLDKRIKSGASPPWAAVMNRLSASPNGTSEASTVMLGWRASKDLMDCRNTFSSLLSAAKVCQTVSVMGPSSSTEVDAVSLPPKHPASMTEQRSTTARAARRASRKHRSPAMTAGWR